MQLGRIEGEVGHDPLTRDRLSGAEEGRDGSSE